MAESTSKRLKPTDPEEATVVEDRISNLPDSLLCHVLSFLTTKEAVVTSILSSRWTTLWTLVPKLDFNSHQFEEIPYSDEEEQSPNHQDHDPNKDYGKKIRDFIGALSNVKSLHLASNLTQCLCYATKTDLPMFHNLACLSIHIGYILWDVLPNLLHQAPNLAVLVFNEEVEWYNVDEEYTFIIETIFNEDVPICISSHLQTFHFKGFKGSTYELEFVRHILKTARFLKTMTVSSARMNSEEKVRVLKELLMFPRESRTCQIAFN
ncbi:putative F-box/LRR-repeat protein At3g42770 isoform X3 [Quercus robur]|uniref:putative F-box/LRR-repeat protein At3g42770 isoform X3 n=1 Tax=Quercus robur TaxID=38942 RepID=UPI002161E57F|nr:putative F-box/LRR-repeat protein At3g42770 isoform X3 [Quercus robur]